MLQKTVIFLIIFFSAIFQSAVFSNLFFWNLGPNIILLLVIYWTVQEGFEKAFRKNILAGFVLDLSAFHAIGVSVAAFTLIAFSISLISKRFLVVAGNWRIFTLILTISFSTLVNNLFLNCVFTIAGYFGKIDIGISPVPFFSLFLAKEIALNILFFPLIYFLLKKIERSGLLQVRKKTF